MPKCTDDFLTLSLVKLIGEAMSRMSTNSKIGAVQLGMIFTAELRHYVPLPLNSIGTSPLIRPHCLHTNILYITPWLYALYAVK
jgi:hypothetical protein